MFMTSAGAGKEARLDDKGLLVNYLFVSEYNPISLNTYEQ